MKTALQQLKNRSKTAWTMGWVLVLGLLSSGFATNPADSISRAICSIYTNFLSNRGMIFAIVLIIVAWAGYMIYMGKREATDVIVKALIATAIILGATTLAGYVISGQTCAS